ncbi:AAA family ATPase [Vibrio astriarenae]|uniref:AAA family ATPase n=1 Tax=Vibrio astriarenae TaxID=1481923 RepID=UPI0037370D6F
MSSLEVVKQSSIETLSKPSVPKSLDELDIPLAVVDALVLKHLSANPKSDILLLTKALGVNSNLVQEILSGLKQKSLIEVFQGKLTVPTKSNLGHVLFALSEQGKLEADLAYKRDAYLGPIPVSVSQYEQIVISQDIKLSGVTRQDVERAMAGVYGGEEIIGQLGPAINSGRAVLMYGDAGTGKTYVATKLLDALNSPVFIPYSVFFAGNIIKVIAPQHHEVLDDGFQSDNVSLSEQFDRRWALCSRPNIQVGGELTMDMLEVNHCSHSRVWMAPLQMMANNGVLVIDDLGRQAVPVDRILNRWIVPMEYRFDQFSLPNGQQMVVPFVLTLAFSTNFLPSEIGDPAFLRRLGYKIKFKALDVQPYVALWQETLETKNLAVGEEALDCLLRLHEIHKIEHYPCLPKDLVGICSDIVSFERAPREITPEIVTRSWGVYFTDEE